MSRWIQSVVIIKVVCVVLLTVIFLLTAILTNVFVDADGNALIMGDDRNMKIKSLAEIFNGRDQDKQKNSNWYVKLIHNENRVNSTQTNDGLISNIKVGAKDRAEVDKRYENVLNSKKDNVIQVMFGEQFEKPINVHNEKEEIRFNNVRKIENVVLSLNSTNDSGLPMIEDDNNESHHKIAKTNVKKYITLKKTVDQKQTQQILILNILKHFGSFDTLVAGEHNSKKSFEPSINDTITVNRKRRSTKVHKVTNVKIKRKINKYLNTNVLAKKKLVLKTRHKRQINNTQGTTRDFISIFNSSDEDTRWMSRDNGYSSDGLLVGNSKIQEVLIDTQTEQSYKNDIPLEDDYDFQVPKLQSFYSLNSHRSALESKYPHVFIDPKSEGENSEETSFVQGVRSVRIRSIPKHVPTKNNQMRSTTSVDFSNEGPQGVDEITSALIPKHRYKITLNMSPKNDATQAKTGFENIHTNVNKSFDVNGVHYITFLNVSEIYKVEKLNQEKSTTVKSRFYEGYVNDNNSELKQPKQQKLLVKMQKKKIDEQPMGLSKESHVLDKNKKSMNKVHTKYLHSATPRLLSRYNGGNELIMDSDASVNGFDVKKQVALGHVSKSQSDDKIFESVKHSENITGEILKRIDTNTNILQVFLRKFFDNQLLDHENRKENKRPLKTTSKNVTSRNVIPKNLKQESNKYKNWPDSNIHGEQIYNNSIQISKFKKVAEQFPSNIFLNTGRRKFSEMIYL